MREEKKKDEAIGPHTIHVRVTREPGGNWVPTLHVDGPGTDGYSSTYYRRFDTEQQAFDFAFQRGREMVSALKQNGQESRGERSGGGS